jgi:hypothetical protein
MSGYVASARIVHAVPRLVRADGPAERPSVVAPPPPAEMLIVESDPPAAGAASRIVERAEEHVAAVRERWSQLTFFLFDPNSWR